MMWSAMTSEAREAYIQSHPEMTYEDIGDALDTSKGAIAGFAFRCGIKRPKPVVEKRAAPKRAARPPLPVVSGHPVTLMALEPCHCRWPVHRNAAGLWMFCGAPKAGDSSYCEVHAAVARDSYQPGAKGMNKPADYGTRKAAPESEEPDAFDVLRDDADEIAAEPHVRVHARDGAWAGSERAVA